MRVLSISADRSKRGVLYPGSPAFKRQEGYAGSFGNLDIIAFSLRSDRARFIDAGPLRIYPTSAVSKFLQAFYAVRIARSVEKPDVVSAQDPFETGLVAWFIALLLRRPLHVQVHTDFLSPEYARLSFLNRIRVILAGFVLRRAMRVRVVSERIKMSIETRFKLSVPITVLPIFVDVARIREGKRDQALESRFNAYVPKLLVVSRLEAEKNIALAIRAYAASAPPNACLIIVGEGSEREALSKLTESLKARRVFFEGERDAMPYYALADLMLFPSKYDGYGIVLIEALAAGKPALSTDVGVAREAGAIVTSEENFTAALAGWFERGPWKAELKQYPYNNFDEYVSAYRDDIAACTHQK